MSFPSDYEIPIDKRIFSSPEILKYQSILKQIDMFWCQLSCIFISYIIILICVVNDANTTSYVGVLSKVGKTHMIILKFSDICNWYYCQQRQFSTNDTHAWGIRISVSNAHKYVILKLKINACMQQWTLKTAFHVAFILIVYLRLHGIAGSVDHVHGRVFWRILVLELQQCRFDIE